MTTSLTDLKVIRHYGPGDVDAIYNGQYIGSFKTRQEAQIALDDHAMRLIEDGLVDLPLTLLDAQPVVTPPDAGTYTFTRAQLTKALDGAIEMFLEYQCQHGHGEMESRLLAADEVIQGLDADRELVTFDPTERLRLQLPNGAPDAGAAVARQWHRDRSRFLAVLSNLDRDAWRILAEAYCAWMNAGGTQLRADHVLAVWRKMIDADITLPPRAA